MVATGRHLAPAAKADCARAKALCANDECIANNLRKPTFCPCSEASAKSLQHCAALRSAVLARQHNEWAEFRRYIGLDIPDRSRIAMMEGETWQYQEGQTITSVST